MENKYTLADLQDLVDQQAQKRGGYWSDSGIFIQLVNETGELGRIINPDRPKKKEEKELEDKKDEKISDELADIFYALICFANKNKIDLSSSLLKKMGIFEERDKERFR